MEDEEIREFYRESGRREAAEISAYSGLTSELEREYQRDPAQFERFFLE